MKKLMTAAIYCSLIAGAPAFAADNAAAPPKPATQPTQEGKRLFLMRTTGDGGGGSSGLPPAMPATPVMPGAPGDVRVMKRLFVSGSVPEVNVSYSAFASRMEKAAWLGVSTAHPPQVLLKQLKLKTGLVVNRVEPKSPADEAGLKADDLIEKLDDQLLINPAQLEGLVRMHNPGDSITLTILREGAQSTITAKLVEHDVLAMDVDGPESIDVPPGVMQAAVMQANVMPAGVVPGGEGLTIQSLPDEPTVPGGSFSFDGSSHRSFIRTDHVEVTKDGITLTPGFESAFDDGANALTVIHRNNQKVLIIKDRPTGKQLFEGPIDTAEQQAKIPKELQPSFNAMQKMAEMAEKSGPETMPVPAPKP